jgi:hypothetical protein
MKSPERYDMPQNVKNMLAWEYEYNQSVRSGSESMTDVYVSPEGVVVLVNSHADEYTGHIFLGPAEIAAAHMAAMGKLIERAG